MNKKIAYFHQDDVGKFIYGEGHYMNPKRIEMTHSLIVNYGIYQKLY